MGETVADVCDRLPQMGPVLVIGNDFVEKWPRCSWR
jgi:hypothetical protein